MKTNVKTLVANVVMEWMLVDARWMLHRVGFQYHMTFNIPLLRVVAPSLLLSVHSCKYRFDFT